MPEVTPVEIRAAVAHSAQEPTEATHSGSMPEGAVVEKLAYNAQRADHKPENRAKEGGKKF